MRARVPAVVLVVALLAACGGDDDSAESGDTQAPVDQSAGSAPSTSGAPLPHTSLTECEDVPDPVDYPADSVPQALRPCTSPTALNLQVIRGGVGKAAESGDTLVVDYTGVRSASGEMFDSSYLRGLPLDFVLGHSEVVPGWEQGLVGAQAGSLVKLDVPGELAYGANPPSDDIQPGDALTFVIEVHAVVPPVTESDAPLDLVVEPSTDAKALGVVDVTLGDGTTIEAGDTAILHMLLVRGDNLKVLLDTWKRKDPLQVIVADGQTLPGIVEGIQGARVGGTRVLTLPPDLAFGPDGEPGLGLPAGTDLIVVAQVFGKY